MATVSARVVLMTMAKCDSKRNRGGGCGNGSGGGKGGDGSRNFVWKPNFRRHHHHFCRRRMGAG